MKKGLREIIVIFLTTSLAIGSLGFLTARQYSYAASEFPSSGYILDTSLGETSPENVNLQYYFNEGEKYTNKKTSATVDFKTTNGEKVSLNLENFIHYSDNSMSSFAKSVILDTDNINAEQSGYYALPKEIRLQNQGTSYTIANAGETLNLENCIWKISESQYMVVSPTITLWITEDSFQSFSGYVQVQYKDSGIAYIVNQEGTYSTVSSGAYLELENGIRVYLGSKNVSNADGILLSLTQMVVNSSDKTEIIPDEEYKNENIIQPQIIVEANDGQDGIVGQDGEEGDEGEEGDDGEDGEEGDAGSVGTTGTEGNQGNTGGTGQTGLKGITGEDGEEGGDGAIGNPGNSGIPGTQGDPGRSGTSADTAGVTYTQEEEPVFSVDITPLSYGFNSVIKYTMDPEGLNRNSLLTGVNEQTGQSYDSYVTIVETATGNMVYRTYPGENWKENGTSVNCDILNPSTNYTYIVTATYTNANGDVITKDVLTKYFSTSDLGLSMKYKYVTDHIVAVDFLKTCESNATVYVKVLDPKGATTTNPNGTLVGYMQPEKIDGLNWQSNGSLESTFDIGTIEIDKPITLLAGGLDSNTTYNFELVFKNENLESGIKLESGYAFPVQSYRTLKQSPSLGTPVVDISGLTNSFIISPGEINDKDNGIVSYRYEIYNANALTGANGSTLYFSEKPVYTVESDKHKSIKVKVDDNQIKYGSNYIARIVGVFNNNEKTIEYSSTISSVFSMDKNSVWPSLTNSIINLAPSAIDGKITVDDSNFALSRESGNRIQVFLTPATFIKIDSSTNWNDAVCIFNDDLDAVDLSGNKKYEAAKFDITYNAIGLKEDTNYTLSVVVSSLAVNGEIQTNNGSGVVIMTDTFKTPLYRNYDSNRDGIISSSETGYNNLSMYLRHDTPGMVINTVTEAAESEFFKEYFYFYTKPEDTGRGTPIMNGSSITGYNPIPSTIFAGDSDDSTLDMQHFSAKSMAYIEFYLCKADGTVLGTCRKYIDSGKYSVVGDEKQLDRGFKFRYNFGYPMTVPDIAGPVIPYTETTDIAAFAENPDNETFGICLTIDDFIAPNGEKCRNNDAALAYMNTSQAPCLLKVKAYDYTYGWVQDGSKAIWNDGINKGNLIFDGSLDFNLQPTFPIWSLVSSGFDTTTIDKNTYVGSVYETKVTAGKGLPSYSSTKTESDVLISNYPSDDAYALKMKEIFDELKGGTAVALKINGPARGILTVADKIQYEVYSSVTLQDAGENQPKICTAIPDGNRIASSGWLDVNSSASTFPSYIFFVDETNAERDAGNTSAKDFYGRGHDFYVVAHVQFKDMTGYTVPNGSGGTRPGIYPDDYINHTQPVGTDVQGYLYQKVCFDKQAPTVSVAQKDGVIDTAGAKTVYYTFIKDVDEALVCSDQSLYKDYKTNFEYINFYGGSGEIVGKLHKDGDNLLLTGLEEGDTASANGITSNSISVRYKKTQNATEYSPIVLDSSKNLLKKNNLLYLVNKADLEIYDSGLYTKLCSESPSGNTLTGNGLHLSSGTRDTTFEVDRIDGTLNEDKKLKIGFYFVVEPDASETTDADRLAAARSALLRYDLKFTDASDSSNTVLLHFYPSSTEITGPDKITVGSDSTSRTVYLYKLVHEIKCIEEPSLVAFAGKTVNIDLTLFSQGNTYGLDRVTDNNYISAMSLKDKTAGYRFYYPDGIKMTEVDSSKKYQSIIDINSNSDHALSFNLKEGYSYRYKDNMKNPPVFGTISSEYDKDGLKYIPAQINRSSDKANNFAWHSGYTTEISKITFVSGYSRSNMTIEIGRFNTVDMGNKLKVVYIDSSIMPMEGDKPKTLTYQEWLTRIDNAKNNYLSTHSGDTAGAAKLGGELTTEKTLSELQTSDGKVITSLDITGLEKNKQYYFAVLTDENTASETEWKSAILNTILPQPKSGLSGNTDKIVGYFTTVDRIQVDITDVKFVAKPDARDSKTAEVKLHVTDALWSDINGRAVTNVKVDIKNADGVVSTLDATDAIKNAFPVAYNDDSQKCSYDVTVSLNWKPLTNNNHLMGGPVENGVVTGEGVDYESYVSVTYPDSTVDQYINDTSSAGYASHQKMMFATDNLKEWTELYKNKSYFEIIPKASYDYEGTNAAGNNATITFQITGKDALRVFDDGSVGKVRYAVELMKGSERVGEIKYSDPMTINTSNGNIAPVSYGSIVFSGLAPAAELGANQQYWLRATLKADTNNDGKYDEIIVERTPNILTPSKDIAILSVVIRPSKQLSSHTERTVTVTGTNLEQLTGITYSLTKDSVSVLNNVNVNLHDASQWVADESQNNTYYLCIPQIDSGSSTYRLTIEFKGQSETWTEYRDYSPSSSPSDPLALKQGFVKLVARLSNFIRR